VRGVEGGWGPRAAAAGGGWDHWLGLGVRAWGASGDSLITHERWHVIKIDDSAAP